MNEVYLYEVLVPCKYEDTQKPVSTRHHISWDNYVTKLSGGLTIFKPVKGRWVYLNKEYNDRNIPVRIACTREQLDKILKFTKHHYRQIAVMAYKISEEVIIYKED